MDITSHKYVYYNKVRLLYVIQYKWENVWVSKSLSVCDCDKGSKGGCNLHPTSHVVYWTIYQMYKHMNTNYYYY